MPRHEHVVQLYGSDDQELTRNVARFLTEGFARGEGLLLIATPAHTDVIVSGLAERGIDVPRVVRDGQLVALDAESLLGQLSANGMPDAARFDAVMGGILRSIRTRSGSEMVC